MVLVLFVILGTYLLIRICADNASLSQAQKRISDSSARKEKWCSAIEDEELENELRLFISRPENRDAVLEQVSEVYDKILDGKRIDEFYPRDLWCKKKKGWSYEFHEEVQTLICKLNSENSLRIMMAKRGHLTRRDAVSGSYKGLWPCTRLEAEVIAWCAEELERHGLKEKFSMPTPGLYGAREVGWEV